MSKRSKALIAAAVAVPLAVIGAGTAYAAYYQDRALPGSKVAGTDVSGMSRAQLTAALTSRLDKVTVTVKADGGTRVERLSTLGYTVDIPATVDKVLNANQGITSVATAFLGDRTVDAVVKQDPTVTNAYVADLVGRAGTPSANAAVVLAKNKASFTVRPAVVGKTVDPSTLQDLAKVAALGLVSTTAEVRFVEQAPTVTTQAAKVAAAAANALVKTPVTVAAGTDTITASAKTKASWISVPTTADGLGTPTLSDAKIVAWVKSVAKAASSQPTKGVRLVGSAGNVLRVQTQARDGRQVTNAAAIAAAIKGALAGGKGYAGTFATKPLPAKWTQRAVAPGAEHLAYPAAVGEKWIDVNLSRHTMTAYIGGTVVFGPVAMVNGAPATPSLVGTYFIQRKYAADRMRGRNADGTTYDTPDVPWVSYFHGGYALHGAPWRSTFGYAASHGCINLPVSTAKWVYDWAPIGTAVASHF